MNDYQNYITTELTNKRGHDDPSDELIALVLEAAVLEYITSSNLDEDAIKELSETEMIELLQNAELKLYINKVIQDLETE